jgi:chromosome partition protein MukE
MNDTDPSSPTEAATPADAAHAAGIDLDEAPAAPARSSFRELQDVILDESFPEVDLALRRGRHIHPGDERWYEFLLDAQGLLEPFYRRFGCALEQRTDGYFFQLPVSDGLGKRHLGVPEMIVGQGLALCFLDPRSLPGGGVITREELLNQLASVMGTDALMQALNPKRKRADERLMQRTVRQKVNEALRRLSQLGFVELLDGDQLRLWPSLMRFAEPVRGLDAPSEALKRLLERGEVSLGPGDPDPDPVTESDSVSDSESDSDSVSDSESDSDSDSDSETETESDSETETESDSDSETESDSESETESDSDSVSLPPELDLEWDSPPGEEA